MRRRITRPTLLTGFSAALTVASISATAGFLIGRYPMLRQFVPVHFDGQGLPNRWQLTSYLLVLMPVWIQIALALTFGAIAGILLYRASPGDGERGEIAQPDADRMLVTAEAISLLAAIWVTFQGLAAVQLMSLWQRGWGGFGKIYGQTLVIAIVASVVVGIRAASSLRQSQPASLTADSNWRFRALYFNPQDPALFVPVRSGFGWTVNFGRPGAILLMMLFLIFGIGAPLAIMRILLG